MIFPNNTDQSRLSAELSWGPEQWWRR